MKTKTQTHTPGPWTAHIPEKGKDGIRHYYPSVCIGECRRFEGKCFGRITINEAGKQENGDDCLSEFDDNARLIAAAPDLLDAAKEVFENFGDVKKTEETGRKLLAAIEKAEGKL